jgi:hypothetical protein
MAAFLDNTGDILLDAVLTDYGRQLLARGDGSFSIVKFAFGDDEIDYSLWNTGGPTATKDVNIVATPILEAFTNNAASMKSKLLTIGIENLLYLPILKIDTNTFSTGNFPNTSTLFTGFVAPVELSENKETSTALLAANLSAGLLNQNKSLNITIHQGVDSTELSSKASLKDQQPELYETEYNISIDNRLGFISANVDTSSLEPISVDDDNIATYKISLVGDTSFVSQIPTNQNSVIAGWKGTQLSFTIIPNPVIISNNTLFDSLGQQLNLDGSNPYRTIRTSVTVTGVTTGYSVEIPVLFAKIV